MSIIRKITIGVINGIFLYLPPHKRQSKRLAWLQGLLYPYAENESAYYTWRDEMIIAAKVTGQKASLQWYLNHLYDPLLQRILIIDAVPGGFYISLRTEADAPVILTTRSEADLDVFFSLRNESNSSLPKDFRVLTPNTVNIQQLKATVDLYNMAHKSYDVVTF